MKKLMTTRELVLLCILILLIIVLAYINLVQIPVDTGIEQANSQRESEQTMIDSLIPRLARLEQMQKELEEIRSKGKVMAIPEFDNSEKLIVNLHSILSSAINYSLTFGNTVNLEGNYIVCRPLNLKFSTEDYAQARMIIDALHESPNINQISNLTIEEKEFTEVSLTVTFFELQK